jgi:hypothetical protein
VKEGAGTHDRCLTRPPLVTEVDYALENDEYRIGGKGHQGKHAQPVEEQLDAGRKVANFGGLFDLLRRLPSLGQWPAPRTESGVYFDIITWGGRDYSVGDEGGQED